MFYRGPLVITRRLRLNYTTCDDDIILTNIESPYLKGNNKRLVQ